MPNADMNRLMDNARIRVPGALDAALKLELFTALDEFFQDTNLWYEDIGFAVEPTTATYLENPSAFTYEIHPVDGGTINRLAYVVGSGGQNQGAIMPIPGTVILSGSPAEADTFTARVFKTITDPVTRDGYPVFPDWVMNKYGGDILDGLLGRMMSQIAKPYSNTTLAAAHLRRFSRSIGRAKTEATRGNLYRGQRWQFPQSFARGR